MPKKIDFIRYFINSSDFENMTILFFDGKHTISPEEGDGCLYYSEVYIHYLEKEIACGGCLFFELDPIYSPLIYNYFTRKRSEKQLFSFAFGLWWGLSEAQLQAIDEASEELCWEMLDYFLCNEDQQQTPPPEAFPYYYQGRYLRWGPEELEKAETLTGGEWVDIPKFLREEQEEYLARLRER